MSGNMKQNSGVPSKLAGAPGDISEIGQVYLYPAGAVLDARLSFNHIMGTLPLKPV